MVIQRSIQQQPHTRVFREAASWRSHRFPTSPSDSNGRTHNNRRTTATTVPTATQTTQTQSTAPAQPEHRLHRHRCESNLEQAALDINAASPPPTATSTSIHAQPRRRNLLLARETPPRVAWARARWSTSSALGQEVVFLGTPACTIRDCAKMATESATHTDSGSQLVTMLRQRHYIINHLTCREKYSNSGWSIDSRPIKRLLPACEQRCRTLCSLQALLHGNNGRCFNVTANSKVRMSRHVDSSTTTQMAKIVVQHRRSSCSS